MKRSTFKFDGGEVRLTDVGYALVQTGKMLGTLLAAASAIAFMLLASATLAAYFAGFHPLGF